MTGNFSLSSWSFSERLSQGMSPLTSRAHVDINIDRTRQKPKAKDEFDLRSFLKDLQLSRLKIILFVVGFVKFLLFLRGGYIIKNMIEIW